MKILHIHNYYQQPGGEDGVFEHETRLLENTGHEVVTYQRADGVQLSGTLYFPIGYEDGQKVPVIFWIYPREFTSADLAGQVTGSPNRFVLPSGASPLFLLTQGYAVLDNPTLPVIGGDTANNTYVEQTVAGALAAVDYLRQRGIANGNFGVVGTPMTAGVHEVRMRNANDEVPKLATEASEAECNKCHITGGEDEPLIAPE